MFFYYKYRRIVVNICMNVNGFNTKDIDDIIEEYESEQTFTKDGKFLGMRKVRKDKYV